MKIMNRKGRIVPRTCILRIVLALAAVEGVIRVVLLDVPATNLHLDFC